MIRHFSAIKSDNNLDKGWNIFKTIQNNSTFEQLLNEIGITQLDSINNIKDLQNNVFDKGAYIALKYGNGELDYYSNNKTETHILYIIDDNITKISESLSDLKDRIELADLSDDKDGGIKLNIRKEQTQQNLPHYHILFKKIHEASYSITSGNRLAGSMPSKYEKVILQWAQANVGYLLNMWNLIQQGQRPNAVIEID